MSKVLFVNGNAHGHINPTLPLVRELVSRGEEVFYFSTPEFKEKIEAANAHFMDYGDEMDRFLTGYRPLGNHPFFTLLEFLVKLDALAARLVIGKMAGAGMDYVIHDAMLGGGNGIAKRLNLPAVCTSTSFAMNKLPLPPHMLAPGFHPQLDGIYADLEKMAEEWGLEKLDLQDVFFKKEPLNIVFTSKLMQPEAELFDESFRFVGPSITESGAALDFSLDVPPHRPLVYISMGTINNNCLGFYRMCIDAFSGQNLKVVLSVGTKTDIAELGDYPENFVIRNHVEQQEVLKHTDVFLSHGGLNSVSEALYCGVPVIAIPQANDQPTVARRLVELGAGVALKMEELTPELLRTTVGSVLAELSLRDSAEKIRASFVSAGGYKTGAELILKYKKPAP